MHELSSINDKLSRLLTDQDDESFDEGSFSDNKLVHSTSSTSTNGDEASSCSDSQMLDSCKTGTRIGINLEVALEIDHEDLYADITSAP